MECDCNRQEAHTAHPIISQHYKHHYKVSPPLSTITYSQTLNTDISFQLLVVKAVMCNGLKNVWQGFLLVLTLAMPHKLINEVIGLTY